MSKSDQFRQYAEEALLWAAQAKTEEEKQLLIELLCTWTAAAAAARAQPRLFARCTRPGNVGDVPAAAGRSRRSFRSDESSSEISNVAN